MSQSGALPPGPGGGAAMAAPFSRSAVRRARDRSAGRFSEFSFLHQRVGTALADRLEDVSRSFDLALVSGMGGAQFFPFESRKITHQIRMDLSFARLCAGGKAGDKAESQAEGRARAGAGAGMGVQSDIEALPVREGGLDLVVSMLELHAVNDLPGALIQIHRALRPGGLFVGAMFGGETLAELRAVLAHSEIALRGGLSPRIFPFADARQMAQLMQRAGFALPVVDRERVRVSYAGLDGLLRDVRGMGEGNALAARGRGFTGKALFAEARRLYQERHADAGDGGRVGATFEVIFLSGWKAEG